jgi:hypothetical protein
MGQLAGLGRLKNRITSTNYPTAKQAGFVVLTVIVKSSMFADIRLCSPAKIKIFGSMYRFSDPE